MRFATDCSFNFGGFDPHLDPLDSHGIRDDVNVVIIKVHAPEHPSDDKAFPKEIRRVVGDWIDDHWYLRSSNNEDFTFKFVIIARKQELEDKNWKCDLCFDLHLVTKVFVSRWLD